MWRPYTGQGRWQNQGLLLLSRTLQEGRPVKGFNRGSRLAVKGLGGSRKGEEAQDCFIFRGPLWWHCG
jgi:hypothetical protein